MTSFFRPLFGLLALLSITSHLLAQNPIVFLDEGLRQTKKELAAYCVNLKNENGKIYKGDVLKNGQLLMTGEFIPWNEGFIEHGSFKFYYSNGKIESEGKYDRGARVGIWKRYTESGTPKQEKYYSPEGASNLRNAMGIIKE